MRPKSEFYCYKLFVVSTTLAIFLTHYAKSENNFSFTSSVKEKKEKSAKLPPCKSCTVLVDSFKKGMEKTNRGKHGGGDAAWEEENLRSYRKSEVRLVEIQEHLCSDVYRGKDQCHTLANEYESLIEEWWLQKQDDYPELLDWLCIETLKVCCPPHHYGPDCNKCLNCRGNGKCKGDGTRKGNGKCACDLGYNGETCNQCANHFYEAFRDEFKLLCSGCHVSCGDGGCTGAGPKGCRKCKEGWQMDSETGCFDINECIITPKICRADQFCVNNEGSHSCLECDRSCNGCDGDGPDMCKECADGYNLRDGKCSDDTSEQREQYANITRFLTYFGLCVATCVIFQSSTHVAYIVGAAVAIYISASEYWLNTSPAAMGKPLVNAKQIEEMIMNSL